jgi:predicted transcriptional regulator
LKATGDVRLHYEEMQKKKRAKNNATRILTLLKEKGPLGLTEISVELKTSDSAVLYALRNKLLPNNFVETGDRRKYKITTNGKLFLQIGQLNRFLENERKPSYDEELQIVALTEKPVPFLGEKNAIPVKLALMGSADLDFKKAFDKIRFEISYFPQLLLHHFAEIVGRQRGLQPPILGSFSPNYDNLRWIKDAYDFEITFILNLNPRETIESLDWGRIFKVSKRNDELFAKGLQSAKLMAQKNKKWIIRDFLTIELDYTSERTNSYLANILDDSTDAIFGHSADEVVDKFVKRIEKTLFSAELGATKSEIKALLRKSLKQKFNLVPTILHIIEEKAGR